MKLTAAQRKEIKKTAEKTGVSEAGLADFEVAKALVAKGGVDALEAAGYLVSRPTVS